MTGPHSDLGPELRQLAQTILDKLDPAVRMAAARAAGGAGGSAGPPKCQQVWCPVCALAALASGEQHPMLGVIAEHSVALLTVIRAVIENGDTGSNPKPDDAPPDEPPPDGPGGGEPPTSGPGHYQHIPVTVEE